MWVGRCALESSGSALRFEIESFQFRVEPMPCHACRGAAEYGCCFSGASRFRGGKSSGLLIDLWVGLVFGWWLALPTSLALLVRATLRCEGVAALARPTRPPLQPSTGPLVAPLLRDFEAFRAVRYAAALVAGAPRTAATLTALRHARVRRHLTQRRRQPLRGALLDSEALGECAFRGDFGKGIELTAERERIEERPESSVQQGPSINSHDNDPVVHLYAQLDGVSFVS